MPVMEILLIVLILIVFYTYFGYGIIIYFINQSKKLFSKTSKQTFQENLRRAENKLIPFLAKK